MSKSIDVRTPGYSAIAKKWNLPVAKIIALVADGAEVEKEHVKSLEKAKQIARDHIAERPDYYKKLRKMEKAPIGSIKEETGVGGVRGLGYVSGDPSGSDPVDSYLTTNAMSYIDFNGNILKMIRDKHAQLHKQMGFTPYSPNDIQNNLIDDAKEKVKLKEGMSAGPERESDYSIGDSTGASRKINKIDEVDLKGITKKAKKVAKVGALMGALGAHAGKVYDAANVASHHDDPAMAAATAASYLHPSSRIFQAAPTVFKVDKAGKGENEFRRQKLYGGKKLKLQEAIAKQKSKAPVKKPAAVKEEGGSSFNEVMGRVYERATVLGVHNGTGAAKSKDKEYLAKIAELQKKQAADLKLLPARIRESALKAADSSSAAYLKSLKENHGVDLKKITEVHHTNKGIGGLIGRNVATRDNPHDLVVRIGAGQNSKFHGASLKKTQGTLGNNSHVQFSAHGKEVGIGHDVANIWNAGLERAKLNGLSKKELKERREDKKVVDAYKKTQQEAIKHHTESFNAASTEMQRKHLRHLMKLNHDPDVPYDYVNGEKGYAKPIEQLDHAKSVAESQRFAAVSRGTSTHIYDDKGRHVLTVEHRATHGPFSSMQANAKLGSLKPPKGETVTMPKEPSHPLAHKEASQEASQVQPEKIKKLLGQVRETRTPQTKAREMKKVASTDASPIANMPRPGIQKKPAGPNYDKLASSVQKTVLNISKLFSPKVVNEGTKMKNPCWKNYQMVGTKKKGSRTVPNCVPKEERNIVPANSTERGIYESSTRKKIKYAVKSFMQMRRIGTDLGQEAIKDKTYQKREKGMKLAMKEDRIDELYGKGDIEKIAAAHHKKVMAKRDTTPDSENPHITAHQRAGVLKNMRDSSNRGAYKGMAKVARDQQKSREQIDEISAELVGKVHNKKYLEKGKAPSAVVARAVKKKWLESKVGRIKEKKKLEEFANTPTNDYTKPYMTKSLVRSQRTSHEHISKPDTIEEPGRGGSVSPK